MLDQGQSVRVTGEDRAGLLPQQNGHREAEAQSRPTSWSQGQEGSKVHQPPSGSSHARGVRKRVPGFQESGVGQALSPGWATCRLCGMDLEVRDQQCSTCLWPCFPEGPLAPAPFWLSPLRNALLENPACFVCGHVGSPRRRHGPRLVGRQGQGCSPFSGKYRLKISWWVRPKLQVQVLERVGY